VELDPVEGRIVGSLIEKQLSTPQQYPLSLNSLTLACNQTSNREPIVTFTEQEVQGGLDTLKGKGLLRFVLPSHGRSVVRYRHVLDEQLALDARQLALLAVLLLRGPQTTGELRTRTERMADFDGVSAVESDLEGLARWDDPLVARLPRRPGQKEERWTQLLTPREAEPAPTVTAPVARRAGSNEAAIEELRAAVEALQSEVAEIRTHLNTLRDALGE
jgi:uncharacterized protein YceH (UPF0502 family)